MQGPSGWNSRLLALAWSRPGCCRLMGNKPTGRKFSQSLFLPVCVYLPCIQINSPFKVASQEPRKDVILALLLQPRCQGFPGVIKSHTQDPIISGSAGIPCRQVQLQTVLYQRAVRERGKKPVGSRKPRSDPGCRGRGCLHGKFGSGGSFHPTAR